MYSSVEEDGVEHATGTIVSYDSTSRRGRLVRDNVRQPYIITELSFKNPFQVMSGDRVRFMVRHGRVVDMELMNRAPVIDHGNAT